ncbi:MAG: DegT/DnrJ/EryC1/StrS family aminotransferase [Chloroflexota bacterium]
MTRATIGDLPPMYPGGNRIGLEEEEAVLQVLRSKRLFRYYGAIDGPSAVEAFEASFADRMGSRHAVAVASGTTALTTALAAASIGPGDQVIVPSYTWVSTAAAVLAVGAVPVLAEVDDSLTIDVHDAETLINGRTRAIIPVHMRGASADMAAVLRLAQQYDLVVIEDAAQAMGGRFGTQRLGSIGHIGCFSLQYNKIITCGEGGVVLTNDSGLHERALMYHDVAASQRIDTAGTPTFYGITCRMSELQGAVAGVQLDRLDAIIAACRANRSRIIDMVRDQADRKDVRVRASHDEAGDTAIALILLLPDVRRARALVNALRSAGIDTDVLFDQETPDLHVACHWSPILELRSSSRHGPWAEQDGEFTYGPERWAHTNDLLSRAVHLDVSPDLGPEQVEQVASTLQETLASL